MFRLLPPEHYQPYPAAITVKTSCKENGLNRKICAVGEHKRAFLLLKIVQPAHHTQRALHDLTRLTLSLICSRETVRQVLPTNHYEEQHLKMYV